MKKNQLNHDGYKQDNFKKKEIEIVNLNDVLKLGYITEKGKIEEEVVIKLVRRLSGNRSSLYQEVSLNSPVGLAISNKKIGDIISYTVNKKQYKIKILKKEKIKSVLGKVRKLQRKK